MNKIKLLNLGLCGSQIAQTIALAKANDIDVVFVEEKPINLCKIEMFKIPEINFAELKDYKPHKAHPFASFQKNPKRNRRHE